MNPVVARLDQPTPAELVDVAELFDQYRHHYGEPLMAGQALAWLTQHTRSGMLTVFTAHLDGDLAGIATTAVVPASLRLGCSWQLRDLYVVPTARRCGVGRALVRTVRATAAAAGAIHLSVQTEAGNTAALQLYQTNGFLPEDDLQLLVLDLDPARRDG